MAATRLIRLHVNKGRTLAGCLKDRIDYAENPDKTEDGTYLSSYHCDPKTAADEFLLSKRMYEQYTGRKNGDIIAYQIRQSFRPGEVSAEEANQIGYDLAMSFTKGRHAFIVATHTDRAHIHNHIIYDATTLDCRRKFQNFFLSSLAIQRISDLLCLQHGLSVIDPLPYRERRKVHYYDGKMSIRDQIRNDLDELRESGLRTKEELIRALADRGYDCKEGKTLSIRGKNQKRFIRLSSLGEGYELRNLLVIPAGGSSPTRRTNRNAYRKKESFSLIVDIQKKLAEGKGKGYEKWAKNYNVKQMAEVLLFLQDEKIGSYEELVSRADVASSKFHALSDEIRSCEKRMEEISTLRKHIINYVKTREIYVEYRKHGYSRKFFEAHREELTLHKAAKEAFTQSGMQKIPKVKELNAEYAELLARKKAAYGEYHEVKESMKKLSLAKRNVETFLDITPAREEKTPEQSRSK